MRRAERSRRGDPDRAAGGRRENGAEPLAAHPPFLDVAGVLRAAADGQLPRIVDARGPEAVAEGRIPGAVVMPARALHPVTDGVRRLEDPSTLAARLAASGVGADPVVVYGSGGGADAAHVWWTLHYLGHEAAYLLDGGIEAWSEAGYPLEEGPAGEPAGPVTPLAVRPLAERAITASELKARLEDDKLAILDVRTAQEYGTGPDGHGAHVPGARLFTWSDALGEDGRLRDRDVLARDLGPVLAAEEVVTYCQSGVRAAHAYALLRWLGHPRPRLFMGSWAEWSRDTSAPRERG